MDDTEEGVEGTKVCMFCLKKAVKYTCPRCNRPYCTVECYRSEQHRDCSEMFYKDCFMEGLNDCTSHPEDRQKVLEMIKRAEADPDLDVLDDPGDDLHERLGDLNLDKDTMKVWDRLSDQEKKEFQVMINDGRLGNLVEIWTPWWVPTQSPLVTEVSHEDGQEVASTPSARPGIHSKIPKMADILKMVPSSDLKYGIINVLYAYTFVCRLHNGEHLSLVAESAQDVIELSDVIGRQTTVESTSAAVQACMTKLQSSTSSFDSSNEFNISLIKDVQSILTLPSSDNPLQSVLSALSDVFNLLKKALKVCTRQIQSNKLTEKQLKKQSVTKSLLFKSMKKCEFFLSWVQTYGMALFGLVPELELEICRLQGELEAVNQSKQYLETQWGGKMRPRRRQLVEEL